MTRKSDSKVSSTDISCHCKTPIGIDVSKKKSNEKKKKNDLRLLSFNCESKASQLILTTIVHVPVLIELAI